MKKLAIFFCLSLTTFLVFGQNDSTDVGGGGMTDPTSWFALVSYLVNGILIFVKGKTMAKILNFIGVKGGQTVNLLYSVINLTQKVNTTLADNSASPEELYEIRQQSIEVRQKAQDLLSKSDLPA